MHTYIHTYIHKIMYDMNEQRNIECLRGPRRRQRQMKADKLNMKLAVQQNEINFFSWEYEAGGLYSLSESLSDDDA